MFSTKAPGTKGPCLPTRFFLAVTLLLLLAACGESQTTTSSSEIPIVSLKGYQVSLFASKTSSYFNPDSLVVDNNHVFIDYQNTTPKTGGGQSTVVEYSMDGQVVKTYNVSGHSDGMRADPSTHKIWTTSNEDGNPVMNIIDTNSGTVTPYTFPTPPHGGGYDDLYFLNGKTYIAASNPSLDNNGNNTNPAVDEVSLSGSNVVLTPILMGNAIATDVVSNSSVTLTLTDPDSLSTDNKGNLVLIGQADNAIITIKNPGTAQQSVTRLSVGTQLDDTVWATSTTGRLLVSDGTSGNTYWISGPFTVGGIYTETPDDSTVAGLVGQINPSTGAMTTIAIGFGKPTGMIFV